MGNDNALDEIDTMLLLHLLDGCRKGFWVGGDKNHGVLQDASLDHFLGDMLSVVGVGGHLLDQKMHGRGEGGVGRVVATVVVVVLSHFEQLLGRTDKRDGDGSGVNCFLILCVFVCVCECVVLHECDCKVQKCGCERGRRGGLYSQANRACREAVIHGQWAAYCS